MAVTEIGVYVRSPYDPFFSGIAIPEGQCATVSRFSELRNRSAIGVCRKQNDRGKAQKSNGQNTTGNKRLWDLSHWIILQW